MEKMNVYIQSKTKPTTPRKSLRFLDKWHDVTGNAVQYFDQVNYKENREIGLEGGKVVFIGGVSAGQSQPNQAQSTHPEPTDLQERIMKTACFNMASRLVARKDIHSDKPEVSYAQAVRIQAEAIYKELTGFLKSEETEDGTAIPMEEVTPK